MVNEFWRRLWAWFGSSVPAVETGGEAPAAAEASVQVAATAPWVVGFDSVLPAMSGAMMVPSGCTRVAAFPFDAVSLRDLFGTFWKMVELRQQWQEFEADRPFQGYLVLSAPGWEMNVFFQKAPERVEWFAVGATGAYASGVARPEQFLQALFLWPDGSAVVGWLGANAVRSPDFGAVV